MPRCCQGSKRRPPGLFIQRSFHALHYGVQVLHSQNETRVDWIYNLDGCLFSLVRFLSGSHGTFPQRLHMHLVYYGCFLEFKADLISKQSRQSSHLLERDVTKSMFDPNYSTSTWRLSLFLPSNVCNLWGHLRSGPSLIIILWSCCCSFNATISKLFSMSSQKLLIRLCTISRCCQSGAI